MTAVESIPHFPTSSKLCIGHFSPDQAICFPAFAPEISAAYEMQLALLHH